ncbi:hypothetical protein ACUH97_04710 [Dermabacteraceae bacterium P13088]
MAGLRTWCAAHLTPWLVGMFLLATGFEVVFGEHPMRLLPTMQLSYSWGLFVPLVTVSIAVQALHTGLGQMEKRTAPRWRGARLAWFLAVASAVALPAPYLSDGLDPLASLRNRLLFFAVAAIFSLVLAPAMAVLPCVVFMSCCMLVPGITGMEVGEVQATTALFLLHSKTGTGGVALTAGILALAAAAYAALYPGWAVRHAKGETVS